MAQAKGSFQKSEIEEYREQHIKRKMDDRARKFKHMLVGVADKIEKRHPVTSSIQETVQISSNPNTSDRDSLNISTPILKTIDLFKDTGVKMHSDVKKISKEDEEFLKKLSPSIRKKENMLCYFQKVSKDSDTLQDDSDTSCSQNDQLIIKVKLKSSKNKAAQKKNKHITSKAIKETESPGNDVEVVNQGSLSNIADTDDNIKKRKRNKNKDLEGEDITNKEINGTIQCHKDRPRRNTKKPVKYADDVQLSSSDEELHIFTPKKKRKEKLGWEKPLKPMVDNTKDLVVVENYNIKEKATKIDQKKCRDIKKKIPKNEVNSNSISKKATKLAPIFISKPLLDSAAIEAKQKFLQSGVPSQLKKTSMHQMNMLASDEFQKVVHVQQHKYIGTPKSSGILDLITTDYDDEVNLKDNMDTFKKLLQVPIIQNYNMPKSHKNIDHILQYIKQIYPKFPVYRTYHLLKGKSKGEFKDCIYPDLDNSVEIFNNIIDIQNVQPDKLNWIDKYKPTTQKQMIGNFESIRELRRWLVTWTENDAKSKKKNCGSDSSDFYQSDTDSREVTKNENNLLIITGKVGTGKTLSVYAVASELAIKVIEVNASAKRTGKIMLQDLQEATQSHKVNRGKNNTDSLQKQETSTSNNLLTVAKKRGRKKKVKVDVVKNHLNSKDSMELPVTQENIRTGMSLILIDDADIVFEQDDGFCNAISQLIQSSKRPVILVATSLSCPHLQKFLGLAKIIKMHPFLPRILGTWLDVMCLVDNNTCSPGFGAKVLDIFRGDIRRTINYLQFYTASHKHLSNIDNANEEVLKANADDENSCMSWGDNEGSSDKNMRLSSSTEVCKFEKFEILEHSQLLQFLSPLNNFYFWWNLPNMLNYSKKNSGRNFEEVSKTDKTLEATELNRIATILDNMSITDYLGNMNEKPNPTSGPWQYFETDSVIDNENFATYDRSRECINDISWELMMRGIAAAQTDFGAKNKTEINFPSMAIQRERDRVVSRHRTLTKCLNPSTVLDRRALALDYWSSCRTICRAEKNKTNNNNKRNNRFCHYLKSLNLVCKNEYFDYLGESLCFKK